jgi:endoglucanase
MGKRLMLVFAFLVLAAPVRPQGTPAVEPIDIHQVLSHGINFDHIFFPYKGNHPLDDEQCKEVRENLKESEFKQVAALGFTHVRLNLGRGFLENPDAPDTLNPGGLALLDQAVQMALQNGLGVVIDMHQTPAPDIFHDPKELATFRTLWENLAAHYGRQPLSVVFEIMNEPAIPELTQDDPAQSDIDHWRSIMKDLVGVIRRQDPARYILVTGGGWGAAENLIQMGNLGFPRLIYTFHDYEPFIFTHQGASWMDKSLSTLKGIHYPVPESQVTAAWAAAKQGGYKEWPFQRYPHGFTPDDMKENLEPLFVFAKKEKLMLYCGEFGALKSGVPVPDRLKWIKDMTDLFRENQVDWANWAYHASYDLADKNDQVDMQVVKALGLGK